MKKENEKKSIDFRNSIKPADLNLKDTNEKGESERPKLKDEKTMVRSPYMLCFPVDVYFNFDSNRAPIYIKQKDKTNPMIRKGSPISLKDGWWALWGHRGKDTEKYINTNRYVFMFYIKVEAQTIVGQDNIDVNNSVLQSAFKLFDLMLPNVPFLMRARAQDSKVYLSRTVKRNYNEFLDRKLGQMLIAHAKMVGSEQANKAMLDQFGYQLFLSKLIDDYLMNEDADEKYLIASITLLAIGAPFLDEYLQSNEIYLKDVDIKFIRNISEKVKIEPFTPGFDEIDKLLNPVTGDVEDES